ncbi:uncharacterized protein LOC143798277 [Ranitomeya variabilis]|uniref:uncharacterized protein LOC143798277 n=1 Tax=Ranitomeya variabilis TaxID=490064 RepID=UPI004055C107
MKDRFNKDLRQESRAASGSGARIRPYKYHRVLSFLRPVLAQRATHSTTVEPGSGAVLQPAATDPSQPSSSAAAGGLHYSANTMTSAVGHPTATTVTTAAPAWTSSTDTTMQQDPGVAFRPGPTTMQQDPGVSFRPGPTMMQQDPGVSFRPGPTTMQQDPVNHPVLVASDEIQKRSAQALEKSRHQDLVRGCTEPSWASSELKAVAQRGRGIHRKLDRW